MQKIKILLKVKCYNNFIQLKVSKISYIEDPYDLICDLSLGIMNYHPFNDGNKRSGFVSLLCLLDANSITFSDKQKNICDLITLI